jgi:hypothetical protein
LEDKSEGALTNAPVKFVGVLGGQLGTRTAVFGASPQSYQKLQRNVVRMLRDCFFVSCWHLNDDESAAMWKVYVASGQGIAMRSTFGRLKASLANTEPTIYGGRVNYLNYEKESIETDSYIRPSMTKRRSFDHEREVRLICDNIDEQGPNWDRWVPEWKADTVFLAGLPIPVDLDALIERVFVAPKTPAWIRDTVQAMFARYEFNKDVGLSILDAEPIW